MILLNVPQNQEQIAIRITIKDNYELFYYDTEEIKPNDKEQIKDF